jgi:division protein 1
MIHSLLTMPVRACTVAPHIMNPKGVGASNATGRLTGRSGGNTVSALSRMTPGLPQTFKYKEKPTATSLLIMEAVPRLLAIPVDGLDLDDAFSAHRTVDKVPLIQGFKATIPSSEMAKQRRRRVRGGVADEEVGGGKIGLKKLGDQARGLLTEADREPMTKEEEENAMVVGRKAKRRRRGYKDSRNQSISSGKELGLEELMRQADEIGMDKENLRVRRVSQ